VDDAQTIGLAIAHKDIGMAIAAQLPPANLRQLAATRFDN
jgi:hypothetical protein